MPVIERNLTSIGLIMIAAQSDSVFLHPTDCFCTATCWKPELAPVEAWDSTWVALCELTGELAKELTCRRGPQDLAERTYGWGVRSLQ